MSKIPEPEITMDDLTVRWQRVYECKAVQGDVQAMVNVVALAEPRYCYSFQTNWGKVVEVGSTGYQQERRARALLPVLRERVEAALLAARWTQARPGVWKLEPAPQPLASKSIAIYGNDQARQRQEPAYYRTLHPKQITFTCAGCGQSVTQEHYPGPAPKYCSPECYDQAQKDLTRQRAKRYRDRKKAEHPQDHHVNL
jgi:hypothetical protein